MKKSFTFILAVIATVIFTVTFAFATDIPAEYIVGLEYVEEIGSYNADGTPATNIGAENVKNIFDGNCFSSGIYDYGEDWFASELYGYLYVTFKEQISVHSITLYGAGNWTQLRFEAFDKNGNPVINKDIVMEGGFDGQEYANTVFSADTIDNIVEIYSIKISTTSYKWNDTKTAKVSELEILMQEHIHAYDNECDIDCNNCGAEREFGGHFYENDCDEFCDSCGFYRSTTHIYDNDCDKNCNVCEEIRDASHKYDNDYDEECNACGALRKTRNGYVNIAPDAALSQAQGIWISDPKYLVDGDYLLAGGSSHKHIETIRVFEWTDPQIIKELVFVVGLEEGKIGYVAGINGILIDATNRAQTQDFIFEVILYNENEEIIYQEKINVKDQISITINLESLGVYEPVAKMVLSNNNYWNNRYHFWEVEAWVESDYVPCEHEYDNDCDPDCNLCSYIRTVNHIYDDLCDPICNGCGYERETEHEYDNYCDRDCNKCGYEREVEGHIYDNDCDKMCNKCELSRVTKHTYDNMYDKDCNACGAIRKTKSGYVNIAPNATLSMSNYHWVADSIYLVDSDYLVSSASNPHIRQTVRCFEWDDPQEIKELVFVVGLEKGNIGYIVAPHGVIIDATSEAQTQEFTFTVKLYNEYGEIIYQEDINTNNEIEITLDLEELGIYESVTKMEISNQNMYNIYPCIWEVEAWVESDYVPCEHEYDNECDSDCNLCGSIREIEHIYTNICDIDCDVCGYIRDTDGHSYDNACDESCNYCGEIREAEHEYDLCGATCRKCGEIREVEHVYDNACDSICNQCGKRRTALHEYDNACDKKCNICKKSRKVYGHVYDNSCDEECNECGNTRKISHIYDNKHDKKCNVCGALRDSYTSSDARICGVRSELSMLDAIIAVVETAVYKTDSLSEDIFVEPSVPKSPVKKED
ncbi:MAG: hypothetical protein J6B60_00525 [Clostridia bacterium]|nr:hypothetical protein [Clostridia bacterium]